MAVPPHRRFNVFFRRTGGFKEVGRTGRLREVRRTGGFKDAVKRRETKQKGKKFLHQIFMLGYYLRGIYIIYSYDEKDH